MILYTKKLEFILSINILFLTSDLFAMDDRARFPCAFTAENYAIGKIDVGAPGRLGTGNTLLHDAIISRNDADIKKYMNPSILCVKNADGYTPLLLVLREVLEGARLDENGVSRARRSEETEADSFWGMKVVELILVTSKHLRSKSIVTDPANVLGPNQESPIVYLLKRKDKISYDYLLRFAALLCENDPK